MLKKKKKRERRKKSTVLAEVGETPIPSKFWRAAKPSRLGKNRTEETGESFFPLGINYKDWELRLGARLLKRQISQVRDGNNNNN